MTLNSYSLFWMSIVVPGLSEELILGADFCQRCKVRLDTETEQVFVDPSALRLKIV